MKQNISVVKRSGCVEPYDQSKIQRQIEYACSGISNVSESMIELNMHVELYDGITTEHLDQLILNSAANLTIATDGHVNYEFVAGRLQNSILRKRVYGQFDPPPLLDIVTTNVLAGLYTPDLLTWYTADEWNLMDSLLDHNKDEQLSLSAIAQFESKYLISNRSNGQIYETPQVRYMVASAVIMHAEQSNRMTFVADMYRTLSNGEMSTATPIAAGLGTNTKQFSSCVKISVDDTLDSIFAAGEMMGKYASKRAGIGFEAGRIRRTGAPIRNGEIAHTGLVPFIKKWFGDLRATSQGGIRSASATFFFPVWHYDFNDLVVMKNNKGTSENRERRLDYAFNTNKYLWRRFKNNEPITLFCPHSAVGLYDAYYSDQAKFIELYERYENDPTIDKQVVSADSVFGTLIRERSETNRIYIGFVDNWANGPIDVTKHPIVQSNLCLTGNTRIVTDQGLLTLQELYDSQIDFNVSSDVRSYDEILCVPTKTRTTLDNFGTNTEKSSKVFLTNESADVYKLLLNNGSYIEATADHKIMTSVGMRSLNSLVIGDYVYVQSDEGVFSACYDLPLGEFSKEQHVSNGLSSMNLPIQWSEDLAFLVGWLIADGFIVDDEQKVAVWCVGNNDTGIETKIISILNHMFPNNKLGVQIFDGSKQIKLTSKHGVEFFKMLGVTNVKAHYKKIPKSIWNAPKNIQVAYLNAQFGADGTVDISKKCQAVTVSYSSTSKILCEETKLLLSNLGINSTVYNVNNKNTNLLPDSNRNLKEYPVQPSYCIKIGKSNRNKFINKVGFAVERKNQKVLDVINNPGSRNSTYQDKFMSKVKSIEYIGKCPVYDITVENSHSFIANGIVVHNCMEIAGPTVPFQRLEDTKGEIFLCTLASTNWGKFKKPTDMKKSVQLSVRMLNNILDYQDFLSVQSNNSNENFRPLGIGVTNLAYWHAKRGLKYGTPESLALVKTWMEHQYFYALSASVDLAKERGPCKEWKDTCYAQGKFVWELRSEGVNSLTDFTPDKSLDWESLRARMQVHGVRNALLGAIAPVESSSVMIGSTNGIAIPKALITTKESKGVSKSQVVPEYEKLKGKYQLMFDTDVVDYLKVAAVMQVYICQSISTDTFYDPAKYPGGKVDATEVARNIMLAQHWGIKTLYYNITNKTGSKKQLELEADPLNEVEGTICESCIL